MNALVMRAVVWSVVVPAVLGLASPAAAQAPDGHWSFKAPYPQPTQEVGGAVVNGRLYILGGYGANAPGGLAGWLNEYNPATNTWTKKADIPMPVHHQAMTGFGDKMYVFGGGVKISADGSPQGKTAYVTKPYLVPPPGQPKDYRAYPVVDQIGRAHV